MVFYDIMCLDAEEKLQVDTEAVFRELKKQNGEKVAQDVRDAHLDDIPNIVRILEFAGRDRYEVQSLFPLLREIYKKPIESEYTTDLDPITLLDMAGYRAWYVTNEQEQNSIAGYFRDGRSVAQNMTGGNPRTDKRELICTIYTNWSRGEKRFDSHYIIHAVKKEAFGDDKLPESEWHIQPSENPERQDRYGTSVISIQVLKTGGDISIKNRYNHTVPECDKTFNNNPDNIIPGLSHSIKVHFNVDFNATKAEIPPHFKMIHDRFIRYNYEVENTYFGSNFYTQGSDITKLDPNSQYMIDHFIWDAKQKKLLNPSGKIDSTYEILRGMLEGKKVRIESNRFDKNEKIIYADGIQIVHLMDGKIRGLNLPGVREVGDFFLAHNTTIKKIELPDLETAGDCFLNQAESLTELHAPKLRSVGEWGLNAARNLSVLDALKLQHVGHGFLNQNLELTELNLPELETTGNTFLRYNVKLAKLYAPKLKKVDGDFLIGNKELRTLDLPSLESVGTCFISQNEQISKINLPKLKTVEGSFLYSNLDLQELYLPELETVGDHFIFGNRDISKVYLPKLKSVGYNFLNSNRGLRELSLPELVEAGSFFLHKNKDLEKIYIPKLKRTDISFLAYNEKMKEFDAPELEDTDGPLFLMNHVLERVNTPKLAQNWRAGLLAKVVRNAAQKISEQTVEPEPTPKQKKFLTWDELVNGLDYPK